MIFLDAYALVALASGEPAADDVEAILRRPGADPAVLSINLAEAADVLARTYGLPVTASRMALSPILGDPVRIIDGDAELAWRAASIRSEYYAKRAREVSLADCFLIGAARENDAIATSDPALAAVARAEGVRVEGLADRRGRKP